MKTNQETWTTELTTFDNGLDDIEATNNKTKTVSDFYSICSTIITYHKFELINGVLIDMQTANALVQVWENVSEENKERLQAFFNTGTMFKDSNITGVTELFFKKIWKVLR